MSISTQEKKSCPSCTKCCSFLLLLGRFCFAAIFLLSGIGKFIESDVISTYMASKGMAMIPFFLYTAGVIEVSGALSLLLGYKTRTGAMMLLLYLIPATIIFHNFWSLEMAEAGLQMIEFLKNLAIIGGLFYIMSIGAGKISVDHLCHCNPCAKE